MLATEMEAKRKQCREVPALVVPDGRGGIAITSPNCQATDCMAWRWSAHTKIENREARPLGFCGKVARDPVKFDLGLGETPVNANAVLNQAAPADAPGPTLVLT